VRHATVWRRALGVDRTTVIDKVDCDDDEDVIVVRVRHRSARSRCGVCGELAPRHRHQAGRTGGVSTRPASKGRHNERGEGRRGWRD
jgi:hypothetical protein